MVHKKLQQLVVFLLPACLFEFPHKQCDWKLDQIKFPAAFLSPENVWNSAYSELTGNAIQLPAVFHNWTEVENFVDAHYQEPIDSTEISRNAQMSYGYFSRIFKKLTNVSPSEFRKNA